MQHEQILVVEPALTYDSPGTQRHPDRNDLGDRAGALTFETMQVNVARWHIVDLARAHFDQARMRAVAMHGVEIVDIDGEWSA